MEQSGEYRIPAPRARVWEALNDPEILKDCIDGCESLGQVADGRFDGVVRARIGPVNATFRGTVSLVDRNPPESYGLEVQAKGGAAGFGKGTASVTLTEIPEGTLLAYGAKVNVGGKLAQIGSRLVDGAARKMADGFFAALAERLAGAPAQAAEMSPPGPAPAAAAAGEGRRRAGMWTVVAGVLLIVAIVAIFGGAG